MVCHYGIVGPRLLVKRQAPTFDNGEDDGEVGACDDRGIRFFCFSFLRDGAP